MSTIITGTTVNNGFNVSSDTSGQLIVQTGSTPSTAMTINSSQVVNFANTPTVNGGPISPMTLISTQTASSSVVTFSGLSGYNNYLLVMDKVINGAGGVFIFYRVGYGSTPTYITSNYAHNIMYSTAAANFNSNVQYALSYGNLTYSYSATSISSGFFYLLNNDGSNYFSINGSASSYPGFNGTNVLNSVTAAVASTGGNAVTAIQLYSTNSGGNISSGTFSLYGISS